MRHFVCVDQDFAPISELIDLARWIKFNPSFITWLVLIVLSGTESNRRINFHSRLAGFNPRLTLIGFPGTGARLLLMMLLDVAPFRSRIHTKSLHTRSEIPHRGKVFELIS